MQSLTNIHFPAGKRRANIRFMKNAAANLMSRITHQLAMSIAWLASATPRKIQHLPDCLRRDVGLPQDEKARPWQDYL